MPEQDFNKDVAADYAIAHARAKPSGECAHYVRLAIAAGGVDLTATALAKDYGPTLLQNGFAVIEQGATGQGPGAYAPQTGDVVVIQPYAGQVPYAGHMEIHTPRGFVSDFIQKDPFWPSNSPTSQWKLQKPAFEIYRFPDLLESNAMIRNQRIVLMTAIDTPSSVIGKMSAIEKKGYTGIIRYISEDTADFPSKRLTNAEALAIHTVPGMLIGLCYESQPKDATSAWFTAAQGSKDAKDALTVLAALNVPITVPVFFAVDIDPNPQTQVPNIVAGYLNQAHSLFSAQDRLIGVYGSGATCSAAITAGVVHYTWLAKSTGYYDYNEWKPYADIVQSDAGSGLTTLNADMDTVSNVATLW